ncbi:MAG: hypothetical protein MJ231_04580 [bacterium]|nr:hypothetical protein [bacterium]
MNNKQQLQKRIQQTELQIKKLALQSTGNEVCEDLYNSLILQKAILKKQLENASKNPLVESVKKIIPHKEKLICDYFKA